MWTYLKLIQLFTTSTLTAVMAYRADFFAGLLSGVAEAASALLSIMVVFLKAPTGTVSGWTPAEALLVTGFYLLTQGVIAMVIQPNLGQLSESIRKGDLDFVLLKPLDAQFSMSTRRINLLRFPDVLLGLIVLGYAASRVPLSGVDALLAAGLYICALVMVYSIWLAISITAFWFVATNGATEVFEGLLGAARFPVNVFSSSVQFVLTFIVPIAFITTVPAAALTGRLTSSTVMLSIGLATVLFVGTRMLWLKVLGHYTSASS